MLPKDIPNIHAKNRSGGGSRRLLPVAYIYPLFCRWYGGRSLASAPTMNRRTSGWPMVLSSLLVAGMVREGIVGGV